MSTIEMPAEDLAKLLLSTRKHTTSEADAVRLLGELKAKWLNEAAVQFACPTCAAPNATQAALDVHIEAAH